MSRELELYSSKLKDFYISGGNLKPENKKNSHFLYVGENFQIKHKRKKVPYTFPYEEANLCTLKYFHITNMKHFLSFYNSFSILNQIIFFVS